MGRREDEDEEDVVYEDDDPDDDFDDEADLDVEEDELEEPDPDFDGDELADPAESQDAVASRILPANRTAALTALDLVWRNLLHVQTAVGEGYVEVTGYDGWYEVRLLRDYPSGVEVLTPRVWRIGPAGSKCCIRIEEGGVVQYRALEVMGELEHADPVSGLYSAASARNAFLTARFTKRRPETYDERLYSYINTVGDEAVIAVSTTAAKLFPPGYCRFYQVQVPVTASARMHGSIGHPGGPAGGGVTQTEVYSQDISTPSGGGYCHPWMGVAIENRSASATLLATLQFYSHPSMGT